MPPSISCVVLPVNISVGMVAGAFVICPGKGSRRFSGPLNWSVGVLENFYALVVWCFLGDDLFNQGSECFFEASWAIQRDIGIQVLHIISR
jgi:hypothetical protein